MQRQRRSRSRSMIVDCRAHFFKLWENASKHRAAGTGRLDLSSCSEVGADTSRFRGVQETHEEAKFVQMPQNADIFRTCTEKIGVMDVGGGFRSIYAAGMLSDCLDSGIQFGLSTDASAGSANRASYAAEQYRRNLRGTHSAACARSIPAWSTSFTSNPISTLILCTAR